MFYLVILPVLTLLLLQILFLRNVKKHDEHLFAFCQLRRDSMQYLADSYESLSKDDYRALRKLIDAESVVINNYRDHKTVVFNFRLFVKYLNETKKLERQSQKISTDNVEINRLNARMRKLILDAFLAYTPFLKSELALYIIAHAASLGLRFGLDYFNNLRIKLDEARQMIQSYNQPPNLC